MVSFPKFRVVASCLVLMSMLGCSLITNVDRNDVDDGEAGSSGESGVGGAATGGTTAQVEG